MYMSVCVRQNNGTGIRDGSHTRTHCSLVTSVYGKLSFLTLTFFSGFNLLWRISFVFCMSNRLIEMRSFYCPRMKWLLKSTSFLSRPLCS